MTTKTVLHGEMKDRIHTFLREVVAKGLKVAQDEQFTNEHPDIRVAMKAAQVLIGSINDDRYTEVAASRPGPPEGSAEGSVNARLTHLEQGVSKIEKDIVTGAFAPGGHEPVPLRGVLTDFHQRLAALEKGLEALKTFVRTGDNFNAALGDGVEKDPPHERTPDPRPVPKTPLSEIADKTLT